MLPFLFSLWTTHTLISSSYMYNIAEGVMAKKKPSSGGRVFGFPEQFSVCANHLPEAMSCNDCLTLHTTWDFFFYLFSILLDQNFITVLACKGCSALACCFQIHLLPSEFLISPSHCTSTVHPKTLVWKAGKTSGVDFWHQWRLSVRGGKFLLSMWLVRNP